MPLGHLPPPFRVGGSTRRFAPFPPRSAAKAMPMAFGLLRKLPDSAVRVYHARTCVPGTADALVRTEYRAYGLASRALSSAHFGRFVTTIRTVSLRLP